MNSKISFSSVVQCTAITLGIAVVIACGGSGGSGGTSGGGGGTEPMTNAKRLALASIMYTEDFNGRLPLTHEGTPFTNVPDTRQRVDSWVYLILPYHNNLRNYVDPVRGDLKGIFSGPGTHTGPNSWRNQNTFPMFAYNYFFLSPVKVNGSVVYSESRTLAQAVDPAGTIFFAESKLWEDERTGSYTINPPAAWKAATKPGSPYLVFWNTKPCSGDWCGAEPRDIRFNTFHMNPRGGNVSFLDGHGAFMTDAQVAAGTSYPTAKASGDGGGSTIELTDKSKYLWNLSNDYQGVDQPGKGGSTRNAIKADKPRLSQLATVGN